MIALGALLVLRHKVPLRETELTARDVGKALGRTRLPDETGKWLVVHVLYEGCGCSAKVLGSLLSHDARPNVVERVAFVSEQPAPPELSARAREHGYRFVALSRD